MKLGRILVLALLATSLAAVGVHAQQPFNQQYQPYPRNHQIEQQNQDACMNDAMEFCGQFVPDRERVAACLLSNRHRVSAPCRSALAHWHG